MRIGIFTDTFYPEANGVATSAYQLKKELENRGNTVFVFTVSNPSVTEPEKNVYRIPSIPFIFLKERRLGCTFFNKWMKVVEGLNLDVIHTQTEFIIGTIGRKAAKKYSIPLIHTYHTIYECYTHYLGFPDNKNLKLLIRNLSRDICDKADEVVVPTDKVKNLLLEYGVYRPITVQPTGIDLSKFRMTDADLVNSLRKKYHLTSENHVLINIGRISREKNIDEVIEYTQSAIAYDNQLRLMIVGGGPEKEHLEQIVKDKNLEQFVIFTGEVEWKDIQNYYALGDVFVSSSTSETQGLTYIEALASGKPLLVRKDECLDKVLTRGMNGYDYTDEKTFLTSYKLLFNSDTYKNMGDGIQSSLEDISLGEFGKQMERIYSDISLTESKEKMRVYEQIHYTA